MKSNKKPVIELTKHVDDKGIGYTTAHYSNGMQVSFSHWPEEVMETLKKKAK